MRSRTKPLSLAGVLVGLSIIGYLSIWAAPADAQTYVFGRADFPTGQGPVAVATGDFNGDGIRDVVVVNSIDNTVSILLGQRNGTLGPKTDFPVGKSPSAVAVGDFNADGKTDLAVTNSEDGTVSILLGNGDGTFQGPVDYATGKGPTSLVAADLNNDGKLDLAVANMADSSVSILLGNGDGSFGPHSDFAAASSPTALVAGDFNGDGKLDLVVAGAGASILLGNGDGTFASTVSIFQGSGPESVAAADISGFGKLDLIIADSAANQAVYLVGGGDGTFTFNGASCIVLCFYGSTGTAPSSVVIGDFNGDGKLDFATADKVSNTVSVALQTNPVNGFVFPQQTGTAGYPVDPSPTALAVADFNGDGKPDLVVTSLSSNSVSIILGRGDGTFELTNSWNDGDVRSIVIAAGDFNGDGRLDVVLPIRYFAPAIMTFLGNGDDTFQAPISDYLDGETGYIATADFNGDGKLDLVTSNGDVYVLLGNGDGTFRVAGSGGVGAFGGLATGDFNRDGKADVVATGDTGAQVLLGNGDGTLQPAVTYSAGTAPSAVAVGDFNGDGKPDLAVANSNCDFSTNPPTCALGSVSILLGNGDGTFQPHVDYATGTDPTSVVVGDFNNDGRMDLAVVNSVDETVSTLLGNGDGTFQPHVDYPVPCSPPSACLFVGSSLTAADFNADGKLDLALVNGSPGLSVLFGNGDGTFATRKEYYSCGPYTSPFGPGNTCYEGVYVVAADFKGNGASDVALLAIAGLFSTQLTVLINGPVIALSPTGLTFAGQAVGTTSAGQAVTVSNPGVGLLSVSNISTSGDFAQTNDCPSGLPAGGTCTITVTFTPTVAGSRSGTLTVTDRAPGSPQLIPLVGNAPAVSLSPTVVNFGRQGIKTTSSAQAITLANTGSSPLNITDIAVTGANSSEFTQTNNCPDSLAPNTSCAIEVTFSPRATGVRVGAVSITDNAAGSPHVVLLSGTGTLVSLSATSLTFAGQNVGTTAASQIVTLTNHGSSSLSITSPATTGDFTAHKLCGSSINAGASCRIIVSFTPAQTGVRNGTLTITDSDPTSPQIVALTGTGTASAVSLSPASLSFAGQLVGTSSVSQTVTLSNTGDGPLTISSITASGDFARQIPVDPIPSECAVTVAPGTGCAIDVVFKPQAGGSRTGSLSIADDAANSPQSVALSGAGQDFAVSATTTSATVTAGQTASYPLSLASQGGFSGAVSLTCTGAPTAATCSPTPTSSTVAASGATPVTVRVATTARSMAPPAVHRHPPRLDLPRVLLLLACLIGLWALALTRAGLPTPRQTRLWAPLGAVLLFIALWAACGEGGGTSAPPPVTGTPAGTYTLTVAATGSGLTSNVSLTLVVN